MKTTRLLPLFLSGLLAALPLTAAARTPHGAPENLTEFFGGTGLDILAHPDSTSLVLLRDAQGKAHGLVPKSVELLKHAPDPFTGLFRGPGERTSRVRLSAEEQSHLLELLAAPRSYGWKIWNSRQPAYEARIIVKRGAEVVMVDLCLGCGLATSSDGRGKSGGTVNIAPSVPALLALFRNHFPQDGALKAAR